MASDVDRLKALCENILDAQLLVGDLQRDCNDLDDMLAAIWPDLRTLIGAPENLSYDWLDNELPKQLEAFLPRPQPPTAASDDQQ